MGEYGLIGGEAFPSADEKLPAGVGIGGGGWIGRRLTCGVEADKFDSLILVEIGQNSNAERFSPKLLYQIFHNSGRLVAATSDNIAI